MALLIDTVLVAALVAVMASLSPLLGPKTEAVGDRNMPYETGMPPLSPAHRQTSVLYARFALLFVVFDVELALLLPVALLRGRLDLSIMTALTVFTALLALMLAYVWRKGVLRCS